MLYVCSIYQIEYYVWSLFRLTKRMPSAGRNPDEGILLEIPFDLWGTGRTFACLRYHIVCSKDSTSF